MVTRSRSPADGAVDHLADEVGMVTATTPLPDVDVGRVNVAVGRRMAMVPCGWPVRTRGGLHGGGILLRVGPVTGRAAGWLRDPRWSFEGVLAAGPRGAWVATTAPALLHLVAAERSEKGRPAGPSCSLAVEVQYLH
jgi:hypothetical protein